MSFQVPRLMTIAPAMCGFLLLGGCSDGGDAKRVTRANYEAIEDGMSYAQVVRIIGSEGEEVASNNTDGVPGLMPSISTKMYSWQNTDGSNMNAMFQNDRLVSKAQCGLQ